MKKCDLKLLGLCVALATVATGCLSLQEQIEQQEHWVSSGQYAKAYAEAATLADDAGVNGADWNFWNADAGALALMAGRPKDAVVHLDAADHGFNDVSRRVYGSSAADTAAAVLVSDGVTPYAPEGVDRVFVNFYKALAFGVQGDADAMRVELNRVRERQNEWFYTCASDIQEQEDSMKSLSKSERDLAEAALKGAKVPEVTQLQVSERQMEMLTQERADATKFFARLGGFANAYAAHVTGITRWCAGDNSRNDLALAYALAPHNTFVAQDHAMEKAGKKPENRVWVYVEDGLAPRRVSKQYVIPYSLHNMPGVVTFDIPELKDRAAASMQYTVNGTQLQAIVDVDELMHDQFNRLKAGIITRQIIRTAVRVVAKEGSAALTDNELAKLFISILFIAYDVSTNVADLRCADVLPKNVWMAAIERPANGVVTVRSSYDTQTVPLTTKGNTLIWVRKPAAGAAATVLVVDLDQP